MTDTLLSAAVLTVGTGATGWCVWHCLRGVRAMRRGRAAASCCRRGAPGKNNAPDAQLAQLRADLAELHTARRDSRVR
ncbi:hypothetical protein [Micromonospora globbae]|uniref:hypothetical protein n=1 Tax=Micromonospora globbae TaxID=1894969 RepID=UPI003437A68A